MAASGYVSSTGDPGKVARSGDTMTGELVLPDSIPDADLNASSKGYVDAAIAAAVAAIVDGLTFSGVVEVAGANFLVSGTNKGYRFRPLGSRLDCEATGSDWQFSVFSGTNYDGTQRNYLRLESGVQLAHAVGDWIFASSPDGGAVHTLGASSNTFGLFGTAGQAKKTVTGSRAGNTALTSLLTQLAAYGLITDGTSA